MPRSREELVEALRGFAEERRRAEKYHIPLSARAEQLHREAFYLTEAADLLDSLEEALEAALSEVVG